MNEFKELFNTIVDKLNSIESKQSEMVEVQVRHEVNLKEHMRRTALLEEEFKPVRNHVLQVRGALKVFMAIIPLAGVIAAYLALR